MLEEVITIQNGLGLHARPAAKLVRETAKYESEVVLIKDGLEVNGKSIMGVMMLAAERGSTLTVRVQGPDEDQAMTDILDLFQTRFGEEKSGGEAA